MRKQLKTVAKPLQLYTVNSGWILAVITLQTFTQVKPIYLDKFTKNLRR